MSAPGSRNAERQARAERLADYFALQLLFAERIADLAGLPLAEAVALYTNFHKRFGLGSVDDGPPGAFWLDFVRGLERLDPGAARLGWTQAAYVAARDETPPDGRRAFGCFSCDPPDDHGALKIHFQNLDSADGVGPLDRAKIPSRLAELRAMFGFVRGAYPSARSVKGGSWLYNLEAYRRLFPPAYGQSRALPTGPMRLNGSSSWGQVLDRHEAVKPSVRDALLRNLETLDPAAPWRAFPLPALATEAPIGLFYDLYDVAA